MGGWEDRTRAAEGVEDFVAGAVGAGEEILIEGNGFLCLVAEVGIGGIGEYVRIEFVYLAIPFDCEEDSFVLALRAVLGPWCAECGRLVPDQRGAEDSPALCRENKLELGEQVDIAEGVEMCVRLGNAESFLGEG